MQRTGNRDIYSDTGNEVPPLSKNHHRGALPGQGVNAPPWLQLQQDVVTGEWELIRSWLPFLMEIRVTGCPELEGPTGITKPGSGHPQEFPPCAWEPWVWFLAQPGTNTALTWLNSFLHGQEQELRPCQPKAWEAMQDVWSSFVCFPRAGDSAGADPVAQHPTPSTQPALQGHF